MRTPTGWVEAGKLKVGDRVLEALPHYLSDFQMEALRGTLMGDGALSPTKADSLRDFASVTVVYRLKCRVEGVCLGMLAQPDSFEDDLVVTYDFQPLPELAEMRHKVYVDRKKVFDDDYLKSLTPLSLALWYMDDANFALGRRASEAN